MFFPSTLVISTNHKVLTNQIHILMAQLGHTSVENNPDIFILSQKEDYSIENIRKIKKFLSQKPYSHQNKIVILPQADLLNIESQNTLLKTLEEPGLDNYFILTTTKPYVLISTILSRCHLVRPKSLPMKSELLPVSFPSAISSALELSETLSKDKAGLLSYLEQQISIYQQLLATHPDPAIAHKISKLVKTTQLINANIDPRTALDFLFLS